MLQICERVLFLVNLYVFIILLLYICWKTLLPSLCRSVLFSSSLENRKSLLTSWEKIVYSYLSFYQHFRIGWYIRFGAAISWQFRDKIASQTSGLKDGRRGVRGFIRVGARRSIGFSCEVYCENLNYSSFLSFLKHFFFRIHSLIFIVMSNWIGSRFQEYI